MKELDTQVAQTINDIALLLKSASLTQTKKKLSSARNKAIDQEIMEYGLIILYCIDTLKGHEYQTQLENIFENDPEKNNMLCFLSQTISIKPYIMQNSGNLQNLERLLMHSTTPQKTAQTIRDWRQKYNQDNAPTLCTTQLSSIHSGINIKQTLIDKLNSKILALKVAKFFHCCIQFNFSDNDTVYDKKIISLNSLLKTLGRYSSVLDGVSQWRASKTQTDIGQIENDLDAKKHRYGYLDLNLWQWIPAEKRVDKTSTEQLLEEACNRDAALTYQCR
jgi:hypothetical protein